VSKVITSPKWASSFIILTSAQKIWSALRSRVVWHIGMMGYQQILSWKYFNILPASP
jgi:hypothetical protein